MKEFVDGEMGEGAYRGPSDYFNALLQEQLKRKAEQKLEGLLQEGLSTESSAVDKKDWEYIRDELESRLKRCLEYRLQSGFYEREKAQLKLVLYTPLNTTLALTYESSLIGACSARLPPV